VTKSRRLAVAARRRKSFDHATTTVGPAPAQQAELASGPTSLTPPRHAPRQRRDQHKLPLTSVFTVGRAGLEPATNGYESLFDALTTSRNGLLKAAEWPD
jgi:hypothetical protein